MAVEVGQKDICKGCRTTNVTVPMNRRQEASHTDKLYTHRSVSENFAVGRHDIALLVIGDAVLL